MSEENETILDGLSKFSSDFIGMDDVADIMGLSLSTVRKWIQGTEGVALPHNKIGGTIRIHRRHLISFLNQTVVGGFFIDPGFIPEEEYEHDPEYDPEN